MVVNHTVLVRVHVLYQHIQLLVSDGPRSLLRRVESSQASLEVLAFDVALSLGIEIPATFQKESGSGHMPREHTDTETEGASRPYNPTLSSPIYGVKNPHMEVVSVI